MARTHMGVGVGDGCECAGLPIARTCIGICAAGGTCLNAVAP